ncbi:MAG: ABC transporter permease subunit [Planctomycetota bacterium]|jgi:ABC-type transport system involved in multi-copper enzyme maturation permease subunit|nr:ABC transporter permease subunit [Planctomycetota bacterium]
MIAVIAGATAREALRSRSFIGLMVIYAVAVLGSRIVGWISGTDGHVVTTDVVFSLQSIIGVLVAVATGTALVNSEIQQRTLYTVLSRPLPRWHFVVGKLAGLLTALLAGQAAMFAIGMAYLWLTGAPVNVQMVYAGILTAEEVCLMAAVSLTWTSLSSPLLAAVLSLATYALGHAVHELPGLMHHLQGWQQVIAVSLASLIPDLGNFAFRNRAVYGEPIVASDWIAVPYGLLWITLLTVVSISVFRRKQL